jgi:putative transposase
VIQAAKRKARGYGKKHFKTMAYLLSGKFNTKQSIKNHITKVFEKIPIYGEKKVHQQLLEDGYKVSLNTVARYRQELGLKAVLAVKQVNTTIPIKAHKKYSYKLRGLNISHSNHVWSTDITYVKIAGGMVYMAAIIDWHSKAVLSHRISNTMDSQLVMSVPNDALEKHPHPEIFNCNGLQKQKHYPKHEQTG